MLKALFLICLLFSPLAAQEPAQTPSVTLYYLPYCPYSKKVINYLQEIRMTIPMKNVAEDPIAREELKKKGGEMRVPCLIIDDQAPIYGSDGIIQWLSTHQNMLESA